MLALGFMRHGDYTNIKLLHQPEPLCSQDQVLIKVHASALNHLDLWVCSGWPGLNLTLPHILGSDAAGEVVAVGTNVKSLVNGDRVAVYPGINLVDDVYTAIGEHSVSPEFKIIGEDLPGMHSEYISVPAKNCIRLPNDIDFATAAASGLVGLTAWRMLIERAKVKQSDLVLIHGAGGGVNSFAISLLKQIGCKVCATTSCDQKQELAYKLGADFVVNYLHDSKWQNKLYSYSDRLGFSVIVDNVGASTLPVSLRMARNGARIVIVGATRGANVAIDMRYIFAKQISILGSTMGSYACYSKVMQKVFANEIKPVISHKFNISEAVRAIKVLKQSKQFGKIVITYV